MMNQRRATMSAVPQGHVATFHAPLTTSDESYIDNTTNTNMGGATTADHHHDRPWWQFGGGNHNNNSNAANNSNNVNGRRRRASVGSDGRLSSDGNLSAGDLGEYQQQQQQQQQHKNTNGNNGPWWAFASFKSTSATASEVDASTRSNNHHHNRHYHHHHHEILIDFPSKQRRRTSSNDHSTCSITNTPHDTNIDDYEHDNNNEGGEGGGDYYYGQQEADQRSSCRSEDRSWWSFPSNPHDDDDEFYDSKNNNNTSSSARGYNNHHGNDQYNNNGNNNDNQRRYSLHSTHSSFSSPANSSDHHYNYNNNSRDPSTATGMSLYRDIVSREFIKRNSNEDHLVKEGDIVGYESCRSLDGLDEDDGQNNDNDSEKEEKEKNQSEESIDIGDEDSITIDFDEDGGGVDESENGNNAGENDKNNARGNNNKNEPQQQPVPQQQSQPLAHQQETELQQDEEEETERLSIIINQQQKHELERQLTNTSEVLDKALDSFRELERSYSDDDLDSESDYVGGVGRNKWFDDNNAPSLPQSQSRGNHIQGSIIGNNNDNEAFLYDYSDSDNGTQHVGTIKAHSAQDDDEHDCNTDNEHDGEEESSIEMGEPTYPMEIVDDSEHDLRESFTRIRGKVVLDKRHSSYEDDGDNGGSNNNNHDDDGTKQRHDKWAKDELWRFSQPDAISLDRDKCHDHLTEEELEQRLKEEEEFLKKNLEKSESGDVVGNNDSKQQEEHQYPQNEEGEEGEGGGGGGGDGATGGGDIVGSEWDSARLFEIKEGVSLSKVTVLDDVSSIASSEHSGKIPFRLFRRTSSERAVGGKSFFGWNKQQGPPKSEAEYIYSGQYVVSSDAGADYGGSEGFSKTGSSKGGKVSWFGGGGSNNKEHNNSSTPTSSKENEGGGGRLTSTPPKKNKHKSSHRSSHGKWSLASSLGWNSLDVVHHRSKSKKHRKLQTRMSSLDEDDDEWDNRGDNTDDDACLEVEFYSKEDAKHRKVVREARTIMDSVNKSTMAMGMEAPFCPADEMFPPMKKLHLNLGYQMDSLQAAIGNSRSSRHRARELKKKVKKNKGKSSTSLSSSLESSDQPPPPPSLMNDHKALTAYIMEQVTIMQQQQQQKTATLLESSGSQSLAMLYTAYLPNFMYFQAIAAEPSSSMRPTSLCSGTGITGDEQYLQPDMLNVFSTFGSYFVGSGHLFQEEEAEGAMSTLPTSTTPSSVKSKNSSSMGNARRSAFWVETIHEQDTMSDDDDDDDGKSSNSSSTDTSSSDSSIGSDSKQVQNDLLEKVIADLRASQMMMEQQPNARVMSNYQIRDKSIIKSSQMTLWE